MSSQSFQFDLRSVILDWIGLQEMALAPSTSTPQNVLQIRLTDLAGEKFKVNHITPQLAQLGPLAAFHANLALHRIPAQRERQQKSSYPPPFSTESVNPSVSLLFLGFGFESLTAIAIGVMGNK